MAGLSELALGHCHQRLTPVDIVLVEPDRLSDAHAGRGKEAEERGVGGCGQRMWQAARCLKERGDLLVGVEVRSLAPSFVREQIRRRDLRARIAGVVVSRKPANGPELPGPPIRVAVRRLLRPAQSEL